MIAVPPPFTASWLAALTRLGSPTSSDVHGDGERDLWVTLPPLSACEVHAEPHVARSPPKGGASKAGRQSLVRGCSVGSAMTICSVNTPHWPRPSLLAWYMATSARRMSSIGSVTSPALSAMP